MRCRSALVVGALFLSFSVAGCATAPEAPEGAGPGVSVPTGSSELVADSDGESAAAREQAQVWLDAANLPPGAMRADASVAHFTSYTGWPCGPVEQLEAFWTIPDTTVSDVANWLNENPTGDLLSTTGGQVPDDPAIDSTSVGYIPAVDSQEGIVYTVTKTDAGVAVRAEIAALTESAVCPEPPGGGTWGAPGQG